ncbi:cytochrome b5-like [Mangifera indica]|uniref:cytochrome b5-like n=1 Tax=Mangifera indica TaxID=29780 RepID=UPI001CFBD0CB|nr:cytochrome b5-like [Mangifera indica]
MAENRIFTLSQIAQHNSKKDCWLVIDGRVLNVTNFLAEHPGGEDVLIEAAGKDATKHFEDIGHSKAAQNMLPKYQVGVLQGYTIKHTSSVQPQETKKKEMEAYVIKNQGKLKYAALFEFFVPLLVAVSYFAYRFLCRI